MDNQVTPLIDPTPYIRPPRLGVDSGLSLSKMLITMLPEHSPPGLVNAAKLLAATAGELESRSKSRVRVERVHDPRPADVRLDRSWGVIQARLSHWSIFAPDDSNTRTATGLEAQLFPTGLDFLTLPYLEQHAQSERRMQVISEGLRESLDMLVGKVFVEELFHAHAAYGDALGITAPVEPPPDPVYVDESLRAVVGAISRYALQVVAFADQDPDNVVPARRALAPIDAFRRAAARRNGNRTGTDEPSSEVEDFPLPEGAPTPDAPIEVLPQ